MAGKPKRLAKTVELHSGSTLMGSKMTINHKEAEIQIFDWGVRTVSKKSKRVLRFYSGNIRAVEEIPVVESPDDL